MREIKFRGIAYHNMEFVYGDLCHSQRCPQIIVNGNEWSDYFPVKEETIGQFTGLHDKNGKEIYEGDIVRWQYPYCDSDTDRIWWSESKLCEVKFKNGSFYIDGYPYVLGMTLVFKDEEDWRFEVIGNIHENKNDEKD